MTTTLASERDRDVLRVDEICVSCRALGRQIEDIMVLEAIAACAARFRSARVEVRYAEGPRNAPAREWLARHGRPLDHERFELAWDPAAVAERVSAAAVRIRWSGR